MNDNAMRFRVGVFVLVALIFLAILITMFSGFPAFFAHQNRYTVTLDNAPGVSSGTPVRRSGVRIGEVRDVELDDETGKVRLTIMVDKKHTIRGNEQPTLSRSLMGDTSVDFLPKPEGAGENVPGPPESEMKGVAQPEAQVLLNRALELLPDTQAALIEIRKLAQNVNKMDLKRTGDEVGIAANNWGGLGERLHKLLRENQDKLVKALEDFNETIGRVNKVLSDDNQRNLSATLKNVKNASDNLEGLSRSSDEMLRETQQTLKRINNTLGEADKLLVSLQKATAPLADRSESIVKNLDESTHKLNQMLTDVRELMRVLAQGEGTIHRFLTDPSLYNNINDASCMILRMMPRVDRALRDMEVFADKLARHPETIGIGGAVRPSPGIK